MSSEQKHSFLGSTFYMLGILLKYKDVLYAVTRVEFQKRYSGAVLGIFWIILYPILLLKIYLNIYKFVLNMMLQWW